MPQKKKYSKEVIVTPLVINNESQAHQLMLSMGVSKQGAGIMSSKSIYAVFKIEGIKSWEANIIKQHLLSLGSDAAIERSALVKDIETSILVFASKSQFRQLCEKLNNQPFSLKEVSKKIEKNLDDTAKQEYIFKARDKNIKLGRPIVCGILNVTDDSFAGDGFLSLAKSTSGAVVEKALKIAEKMIKEGAKILDIGGQSTRPFSESITAECEIKRVIPVLKALRKEFTKLPLSVDTYKYQVAKAACDNGVDIINDIWALRFSPKMAGLIARAGLGCVIMHMKGTPLTMQVKPVYKDVVSEVSSFFKERLNYCLNNKIKKEQICLDPGIGFGKRVKDNTELIRSLSSFKGFGCPIFIGLSRKSFIGTIIDRDVTGRLAGTIAASVISTVRGADVLRVHDVAPTMEALKIVDKIIYS
jgi:dihydropteroate synthase